MLKNRLGLTDQAALSAQEADYSKMRYALMQAGLGPKVQTFDLEHLKANHRFLFQDVYEWAGRTRGEVTQIGSDLFLPPPGLKKGETEFLRADLIAPRLEKVFDQLREDQHLRGLSRGEFADKAATLLADVNMAHPFREGNGRTQRVFMEQLGAQAGHKLDFAPITQERMRVDSISAEKGDLSGFQQMFREITDQRQVALMVEAFRHLEREGFNPNSMYIMATQHGQVYEADPVERTTRAAMLITAESKLLVTPAESLQKAIQTENGVRFTANHGRGLGMEM